MADHEPLTDSRCGEPELSEELRDTLTLLRDDNDGFRALVDDMLAGRRGLVEASGTAASGTAAFSDVVCASIARELDQLTEDDKRRLAAPATSSGAATGSCGTPCAECPAVCALRDHSRQ